MGGRSRSPALQPPRSRSPVPSMMGTISDISHNVEIIPNAVPGGARWTAAQNKSHLYDPNHFTIDDGNITPRSVKPDFSSHLRPEVKELANYAQNLQRSLKRPKLTTQLTARSASEIRPVFNNGAPNQLDTLLYEYDR